MAKKDLSCKKIEDYNEVFADIYNTLLFKGDFLNPDRLEAGATESIYKTDGKDLKDQRRDVLKKYRDEANLVICSFGIENQSVPDKIMPIRVMGYDAGTYRQQIIDRDGNITPVITIVLNMSDKKWDTAKSIHDMLQVNEELKAYVQDYRIHVFDIAFLEDETIEAFTSDFREIARFFKRKRLGENPLDSRNRLRHPQAILEFLSAFTGDRSYLDGMKYLEAAEKEGGAVTMCAVAEALKTEGRIEGRREGRLEGRREGRLEGRREGRLEGKREGRLEGKREGRLEGRTEGEIIGKIFAYYDMGLEIQEISVKVGTSPEETEKILQQNKEK